MTVAPDRRDIVRLQGLAGSSGRRWQSSAQLGLPRQAGSLIVDSAVEHFDARDLRVGHEHRRGARERRLRTIRSAKG